MKRVYLVERKERNRLIPFFFELSILISSITYFVLKNYFRKYDYIIWGSGNLTKILVHYLCQDYDILWVIPQNQNASTIHIENTDIKILNEHKPSFNENGINFPPITDFSYFCNLTGLPMNLVERGYQKLINSCGERFKGCYYFDFSNKMVRAKIIEKHGIDRIKKDSVLTTFFNDNSVYYSKKFIFADTGNLEEIFSYFWNKTCSLSVKCLIGLETSISKTKMISFLGNTVINNDTMTFYLPAELAQGSPHQLQCVYNNDLHQQLIQESQKYLTLGPTRQIFHSQCFGLENLVYNFQAHRNQNLLCLNPCLLNPTPFWVRDFLLITIIAKYL